MDIPDPLYRRLKSRAARERRSVKELILRGVEGELEPRRRGGRLHADLGPDRPLGECAFSSMFAHL